MTDGRSRVFRQPRSWVFWAYLIAFVAGAALWHTVFASGVAARFWTAAIVWVVVLGALLGLLIRRLDLFRGNRVPLLVAAFLWGAVPATAFAVLINGMLLAEFDRHLAGYRDWDTAAVAPLVEESFKAVGIVVVVLVGRRYVVRASQGAVIGATTGLGFQLIEDINYLLNAAAGKLDSAAGAGPMSSDVDVTLTILLRTVLALNSHWLFSALVGLGVGYAVVRRDRPVTRRVVVMVALWVVAAVMHFVTDSPGALDPVLMGGKVLGIVLAGCVIYVFAMRAEWRRFAAVADAEPADVIAPADVAAIRSHRTRRRSRRRTRAESGRTAAHLVSRLQRTQLRLVNELLREGDAPQRRVEVRELRARAYPTSARKVST